MRRILWIFDALDFWELGNVGIKVKHERCDISAVWATHGGTKRCWLQLSQIMTVRIIRFCSTEVVCCQATIPVERTFLFKSVNLFCIRTWLSSINVDNVVVATLWPRLNIIASPGRFLDRCGTTQGEVISGAWILFENTQKMRQIGTDEIEDGWDGDAWLCRNCQSHGRESQAVWKYGD